MKAIRKRSFLKLGALPQTPGIFVSVRESPWRTTIQGCRPDPFEFKVRDHACAGFQLCGSKSASRVMGWVAMRLSTSWNQT